MPSIRYTVDKWFGRNTAPQNQSYEGMPVNQSSGTPESRRTDTNIAGRFGLFQAPYGPRMPQTFGASTPAQSSSPAANSQSSASAPAVSRRSSPPTSKAATTPAPAPAAPVAPTEPQLTKEQQLQIDADMMSLEGMERQAFIEEKRGLLPKIRDTKKYNAVAEAEKASGITTSTPVDAGASDVATDLTARAEELRNDISNARIDEIGSNVGGFEMPTAEDYKKLYDLQQAGADAEFKLALEQLQAKFQNAARNESEQNSVAMGRLGQSLGRSGSFGSISGQSLVTNTEMQSRQRLTQLAQEEALAVKEAQLAKDQNDLTRMESYLAKADEIRAERNGLKEKNIDLQFKMDDRDIAEQERERQTATERASYYGNLTLDQLDAADPAEVSRIETTLGMPTGYLRSVAETQQALAQADSDAKRMELSMELFDKAKELPSGQTFTFADGTQITGFDEPEGKVMEMITADGGVAFVTIDPATGEILKTVEVPGMVSQVRASAMFRPAGGGGGRTSGGSGAVPDDWDTFDVQVAALMRESIGQDTGAVVDAINALIKSEGGSDEDLISISEGMRGQALTPSIAVGLGSQVSTSHASDPSALLDAVEGDYTFREVTIDNKKATVAINNNNAENYTVIAKPEEEKKSGGGILGWVKNIFAGSKSVGSN